jgi:tRNA-i(6)A37 thiotransferase enzyme miaB
MQGKYFINTYGCQMNVHESEKLAGILRKNGYEEAPAIDNADIVVFNTCCVRETAEYRVLGNLGIVKKLKESRPWLKVVVCGCMAQKPGAEVALKKRCPFINLIFGTHNLHKFGEYLNRLNTDKYIGEIWEKENEIAEDVPIYRTSGVNAWVNIMYGCNNFCSYCIVPYVRGRERSRSADRICDDVKNLLNEGYKEITLLGQNVNSYGNDLTGEHLNFAELLERLSLFDGKYKIKFMTSHPKDLSEEVVKTIAASDKLADYIHLPVQAGSDRILRLMNRKYTKADYLKKIDMIRKYIPAVGLSSDVMVGFPTETEEDFLETVDVIKRVGYNNLFTFIYSKRSGTPAVAMDQVDAGTKKERIKRLIDLQFSIGNREAENCVGKTYEVLCDAWADGKAKGKSSCEKAITFKSDKNVLGQFVNVKITGTKNNQLKGELTD